MKRIAFGRARSARDDRLEPLFEVAAEARAGQQRAGVEREDLGVLQRAAASPAISCRASPSAIAVLPTPGSPTNTGLFLRRRHQDLDGPLQLIGPADERVEACPGGPAR